MPITVAQLQMAAEMLRRHGVPAAGGGALRRQVPPAVCRAGADWPSPEQAAFIEILNLCRGEGEDQRPGLIDRGWQGQVRTVLAEACENASRSEFAALRQCLELSSDATLAAARQAAAAAQAQARRAAREAQAAAREKDAADALAAAAAAMTAAAQSAFQVGSQVLPAARPAALEAALHRAIGAAETTAAAAQALQLAAHLPQQDAGRKAAVAAAAAAHVHTAAARSQAHASRLCGMCEWIALAALFRLASANSAAGAAHLLRELFANAARRLCPGWPVDPLSAADRLAAAARDEVFEGLRSGRIRFPEPWRHTARPATARSAFDAYLEYLRSHFDEPESWLGEATLRHLASWFRAVHQAGPREVAADGAVAALQCLGAHRLHDWNWISREFFAAAHTWCVNQWLLPNADVAWRDTLRGHLDGWTQVELVVRGMAWLCGLHLGAPLPDPAWADLVEAGRQDRWLADIVKRMQGAAKHRRKPLPAGAGARELPPTLYRPPGTGAVVADEACAAAYADEWQRPGGPARLNTWHLLRIIHAHWGLIPSAARHPAEERGFYRPLALALRQFAACQPAFAALHLPEMAALLEGSWLAGAGGQAPRLGKCHYTAFDPFDVARLPTPAQLQAIIGGPMDFARLRELAECLMDRLTQVPQLALACAPTCPRSYACLEGRLRSCREDEQWARNGDLYPVHLANRRLFKELAKSNLQHRVRQAVQRLHCEPAACAAAANEAPP